MNLVSIDTEYGALRAYTSIKGNKPKMMLRVDIPNYDRNLEWDRNQIEAFRQDPMSFVKQAQAELDGEAA